MSNDYNDCMACHFGHDQNCEHGKEIERQIERIAALEAEKEGGVTRTYIVKRYVVESFEVEVTSETAPTRDEIRNLAIDPHTVRVLRETVRPVKGDRSARARTNSCGFSAGRTRSK